MKTFSRTDFKDLFRGKYNHAKWIDAMCAVFGPLQLKKDPEELEIGLNGNDRGWFLGHFTAASQGGDMEVGVFRYCINSRSVLKTRVGLRKLISPYVRYSLGAALVVFEDAKTGDWRFSFISDLKGVETAAKRYTYVFGDEHGVYNTPADRFLKLAKEHPADGFVTFEQMREAFSVEALSKEFFSKYKKFYEKFVDYASMHDFKSIYQRDEKVVRDYIKKMMGRLVFLQFLQKKGWLGVPKGAEWGEGDRQFLQNLFKAATPEQQDKFLDEVLEHIFFHALNDSTRAEGELFDTKVKAYGSDNGKVKVPYLNGGLFESDREDDNTCAFPKEYFANSGDAENNPGLLDFFAQYNFTIDENNPAEDEVGVDPEMLSCIFENLLEDNKDKGAYYTPKAIVEYMCRESLTAYLQTDMNDADKEKIAEFVKSHDAEPLTKSLVKSIDNKLRKVKICDPAIGSGAFPMGLLHELQLCRTALEDDTKSVAEIKKEIIQNNIYGVDIEKGAVDIARLRFWLSIVVDEPTPEALPNLDFKIMQGNSLLESYKGVDLGGLLAGGLPQKKKKAAQGKLALGKCVQSFTQGELAFGGDSAAEIITAKMREYYDESDHDKKAKIMEDINTQVKGYIKTQLGSAAPEKEIDALNPQNDKFFLWHTWFNDAFANGGFDIVIGNPPYFNVETLGAKSSYAESVKRTFPEIWQDKSDILFYFFALAMRLSKDVVMYITSNAYPYSDKAQRLRNAMIADGRLRRIINFERFNIFNSASITTCITLMHHDASATYAINHKDKDGEIAGVIAYIENKENAFKISPKKDSVFALVDSSITRVNDKIDGEHRILRDIVKIGSGMQTAANGVFCFQAYPAQFPEKYVKRRMCGEIIQRYHHRQTDEYMLYVEDVEEFKSLPQPIQDYLIGNRATLEGRAQIKRSKTSCWWKYVFPMHKEYYHLNKIWCSYRAKRNEFALDESTDYIGLTNTTVIFDTDPKHYPLKYLLALLNSNVLNFRYRSIGKQTGGGIFEYFENGVGKLPIPVVTSAQQKQIISFVDKILAAKAKDAQADTSELESQIDTLVYDLYGLTEEEIAVVEGK